ncbi:hypothetical protein [Mesorhizobium sp. M0276]|uniref:hypothetical protein n=1 Tax=Mesorhizobium sp. M0276 TaxID=2956928 RepID=UPI003336C990
MLQNTRHECYARHRAKGKSIDEAYALAGYRPNRGNAARLNANESIKVRVAELQGEAAERAIVTIESIARQLDDDRQLARELGQAAAAVNATMSKAKIYGLVTDRHEVESVARKPMREPGAAPQMSLQEWEERFKPKTSAPLPGNGEPSAEPKTAEPEREIGIMEAIRRAKAGRRVKSGST